MFTVEPTDHWRVGDRAYCIRGLKLGGRHIVETGRVYRVAEVLRFDNMMSDGLKLEGVGTETADGFWSSRFVCLRGYAGLYRQLQERTRHGWAEAYDDCRDARAAHAKE